MPETLQKHKIVVFVLNMVGNTGLNASVGWGVMAEAWEPRGKDLCFAQEWQH